MLNVTQDEIDWLDIVNSGFDTTATGMVVREKESCSELIYADDSDTKSVDVDIETNGNLFYVGFCSKL